MGSERRASRRETRRKREYGRFTVESVNNSGPGRAWDVVGRDGDRFEVGTGKDARRDAQALASALDSAGVLELDDVLPPKKPSKFTGEEWESWSDESNAVPARLVGAGKHVVAAYLDVVNEERTGTIASRLDVGEQTVRQYLSDLRADRR